MFGSFFSIQKSEIWSEHIINNYRYNSVKIIIIIIQESWNIYSCDSSARHWKTIFFQIDSFVFLLFWIETWDCPFALTNLVKGLKSSFNNNYYSLRTYNYVNNHNSSQYCFQTQVGHFYLFLWSVLKHYCKTVP